METFAPANDQIEKTFLIKKIDKKLDFSWNIDQSPNPIRNQKTQLPKRPSEGRGSWISRFIYSPFPKDITHKISSSVVS